ncbi:hypothetical protein [Photorhabdus temperata]
MMMYPPWDGAEFAKEFAEHDKKVMEKNKRVCSLETHPFGNRASFVVLFL